MGHEQKCITGTQTFPISKLVVGSTPLHISCMLLLALLSDEVAANTLPALLLLAPVSDEVAANTLPALFLLALVSDEVAADGVATVGAQHDGKYLLPSPHTRRLPEHIMYTL